MAVHNVDFEVPPWVEAGVNSGKLHVFGGVVRDNFGRIVLHLPEAIRSKPKNGLDEIAVGTAISVAVVTVVVGFAYLVYRRFTRKERVLLAALEAVDNQMTAYLVHAQEHNLTLDDAEALSAELAMFLELWRKPEFSDVQISVSSDVDERLRDFVRFLHAFNEAARKQVLALPKPPAAITDGISLKPLLNELLGQIRYQESILDLVRAT